MLKSVWARMVEFHKTRLIANIVDSTKEERKANFDARFAEAKTLSDFIGMIMRFAFVSFAAQYFLRRAPEVAGIKSYALGICWVFSVGLLIAMGGRIVFLIVMYESRDLHAFKAKWARVVIFLFVLATTGMLWYGMTDLANALINLRR